MLPIPHGRAKLTEADVLEIDTLLRQGKSRVEIAERYGIKEAAVRLIERRVTWRYLLCNPTRRR